MNSRELLGFTKIAELGSFSLAADSLYISQSALSQQIRRLEQELGFELFDHSQRRVVLTAAGERFRIRAEQLLAMYDEAKEEGLYLSSLDDGTPRMQIGCLNDQYICYWLDVLELTKPVWDEYAPRPVRYENRAALYAALVSGETDITIQMECADIKNNNLEFIPLTTVHEICVPYYTPGCREPDGRMLTVEDLQPYVLAFHNMPGATLFEDALRSYVRLHWPQTKLLEPKDFFQADHTSHKWFLVPSPQFNHRPMPWAVPLDFEGNIRLGFVVSPVCRHQVREYVEYVRVHLPPDGNLWHFA